MSAPTGILRFTIRDFRGVVELEAAPNGKSVTLRGKNGAGKSSAVDALWWALGGSLDGEVVRNGADRAEVELVIDGYAVRRLQTRGKRPTLTVKTADGKATFNSPTALLSGFIGAIERRTFSQAPAKEQAEILRRLAPGLDCADLDTRRETLYARRTEVGRRADDLGAQARGVEVPALHFPIEEERDLAAIAEKKADVERVRYSHSLARAAAQSTERDAEHARRAVTAAEGAAADLERSLHAARERLQAAKNKATDAGAIAADAAQRAAALVEPDASVIDREIAAAKEHNARVRDAIKLRDDSERAAKARAGLEAAADTARAAYDNLTAEIKAIDSEKAARLAGASLPIPGLALDAGVVTLDEGQHGPVQVAALNSASRIRLDVAIAAAQGHRLIAVRDASLLDAAGRAEIDRFAAARGVQLLAEVVTDGGVLEAVIEEGAIDRATAEAAANIDL